MFTLGAYQPSPRRKPYFIREVVEANSEPISHHDSMDEAIKAAERHYKTHRNPVGIFTIHGGEDGNEVESKAFVDKSWFDGLGEVGVDRIPNLQGDKLYLRDPKDGRYRYVADLKRTGGAFGPRVWYVSTLSARHAWPDSERQWQKWDPNTDGPTFSSRQKAIDAVVTAYYNE